MSNEPKATGIGPPIIERMHSAHSTAGAGS